MQGAIEVLRNHCLGDREVGMEIISDQSATLHGNYRSVNWEDANYNVQLPVFAIHGDHDDPGGEGGLSALDLLASANLLNYFGKVPNAESIALSPLLIRKGSTQVALYGLGHMPDDQLMRSLERQQFAVSRPAEAPDSWFNIMALHQNRAKTSAASAGAVQASKLPKCMDLVIWGHERDSNVGSGSDGVEEVKDVQFQVLQPGSMVAADLVDADVKPKHVALLQILGDNWKLESLPLQTVRPFLLREVVLEQHEEDRNLNNEDELFILSSLCLLFRTTRGPAL